jgi:hypothetical protein
MSRYWYAFQSGNDQVATNYIRVNTSPSFCPGGPLSCAVYARPAANPIRPVLSANLQDYLVIAKGLQASYPTIPEQSYVYVKS